MKFLPIYLFTIIFLLSCNKKLVTTENIKNIIIVSNPRDNNIEIEITNSSDISNILEIINTADKELIKFIPDYKIQINYKDSSKILLIKKDMLNIEGLTYKLNTNLQKEIDKIASKATQN